MPSSSSTWNNRPSPWLWGLLALPLLGGCHGAQGPIGQPGASGGSAAGSASTGGAAGESATGGTAGQPALSEQQILERLEFLSPAELPGPVPDPTNRYADDPAAAELGKKFFFDPRFSGPLLELDNTGLPGTLGAVGETGRVSCAGCHNPSGNFDDRRSPKAQISLGSGWTRRRSPSLLDFGQTRMLMWDGRRDTGYSQPFGVIRSPLEFNSSVTFVAQQVKKYYQSEYEAVFGPMPDISRIPAIDPADAGCKELEDSPTPTPCGHEWDEDPEVTRIVVNFGKALVAYERLLTCGQGRFDAWIHGDPEALTSDEQEGARHFVTAGCDSCHSGPFLSDQEFHNLGAANRSVNFIDPYDDPGAGPALAALLVDPLNSKGEYSDGDDGRLNEFVGMDLETLRGAFRTPTLRCVAQRPTFLHAGQARTLEDFLYLANKGGNESGYQGDKSSLIVPLGLSSTEIKQLAAFLRTLDGPGPQAELREAPTLPE